MASVYYPTWHLLNSLVFRNKFLMKFFCFALTACDSKSLLKFSWNLMNPFGLNFTLVLLHRIQASLLLALYQWTFHFLCHNFFICPFIRLCNFVVAHIHFYCLIKLHQHCECSTIATIKTSILHSHLCLVILKFLCLVDLVPSCYIVSAHTW